MFDNSEFELKIKDLFNCTKTECYFLIEHLSGNGYKYSFGISFLDKYIVGFHYDTDQITFHSKDNSIFSYKNNIVISNTLIISSVILIGNCLLLVGGLYIKNKFSLQ